MLCHTFLQEIAEETWMKYLLRNQSVIVREFQGQLKSTLVCPNCSGISKIFDPFMFLSLPLPIKKTRIIFVAVVRSEPGHAIVKVKGRERRLCSLCAFILTSHRVFISSAYNVAY